MRVWRSVGGLLLIFVLTSVVFCSAAGAAFEFNLDISGPGMRHPVTLQWDQVARAGLGGFFNPATAPHSSLGPAYDLKVRGFLPSTPPRSLDVQHWTYYPLRNVVLFHDASDARAPWAQPVPAFRTLLDQAIDRGKGRSIALPALATVLILLTMVGVVFGLRRHRRSLRVSVQAPRDEPALTSSVSNLSARPWARR